MKVHLIDVDLKYRESRRRGKRFPNLALMKISAWHKSQGDEVELNTEITDPNCIRYISCVFTRNKEHAFYESHHIVGESYMGGSGVDLNPEHDLPKYIELTKPDYDLYPFQEYSMGFTSRGCPRACSWCIVHKKEGRFKRVQHIKEFHDFRFKSCKLLDNNILADKEWFFENTNWAIDNKVKIDITQGMDIRLLTDEIAEQLKRIKFIDQQMRFAWDLVELEPVVRSGIEILRAHGINVRRNVSFFILSGYPDVPFCKDLYRCNRLKEMGAMPYVMPWEGGTPMVNALARWTDRRRLFWKIPFWQYDRMPKAAEGGSE
ncbi:MAG: hypothetical protein MUO73_02895 [Thermoplasmata archaeon]|nr:hypothetical protein [Thermoplasmata archaeon]